MSANRYFMSPLNLMNTSSALHVSLTFGFNFSIYCFMRSVYFSIQLKTVWCDTLTPSNLREFFVFLSDSPLKYNCMAVVTACGLCFIFSKPILNEKYCLQSLH